MSGFSDDPRSVLSRRAVITGTAAMTASGLLGGCGEESTAAASTPRWVMPDEADPHRRTWMAYGAPTSIWGRRLGAAARETLDLIGSAISDYEPVFMLVRSEDQASADSVLSSGIKQVRHRLNDLWMRDTGPVFVKSGESVAGVDFNFNGWGEKQVYAADATVARGVCDAAQVRRRRTDLVLEGGAIEVDGRGTAIITRSCVLNRNRNPGWTQRDVEQELRFQLGIRKVIWLPGIAGRDITDGHTDFYARFTSPGVVVAGREDDPSFYDYNVTRQHLRILRNATDASGRPLKVHVLPGPTRVRDRYANNDFAAGYINFYVCNDAVIAPEFGDPTADARAKDLLEELFPERDVVQLNIDPIAAGGGGIHCTTQQQPA